MSHGALPIPKLIYHVIWPHGNPHVLVSGLSSAVPLIGKHAGSAVTTSPDRDGLRLSVTRPPGLPASDPASIAAMLTGVTFDPQSEYLLEATLTHADGPTNPANYTWAIGLVLKDGNQDDLPTDTRLNETLQFRQDAAGVDTARVNMPGFQALTPPDTILASADYSRVTAASPAIDFTLKLRVNFGDPSKGTNGIGDATVAVNQHPGLGSKSTDYLRHGKVTGASQTAAFTSAGIVIVALRGDATPASVTCKEFKISEF